jgi:hypothetical protein
MKARKLFLPITVYRPQVRQIFGSIRRRWVPDLAASSKNSKEYSFSIPCHRIATFWASLVVYAAIRLYSVSQRFYCCVLSAFRDFLMALPEETTTVNTVLPWTRDIRIASANGFTVTTNKPNSSPVSGKVRPFISEGKEAGQAKHQQHFLVRGSVHQKFVPPGQTVNQHYYQEVLRQWDQAIASQFYLQKI